MFATHLSQWAYGSWIDFGEVRVDSVSSVNDFITIKIETGYFYSLEPLAVQFRNPALTDTKRFYMPPTIAILSTGLQFNMVPNSIQLRFFELLLEGVDYEEKNGVFYTPCVTQMADVEIMVEGCDSDPNGDGVFQNCDSGYNKNKRYFWVVFAGQDMIIDSKVEDAS